MHNEAFVTLSITIELGFSISNNYTLQNRALSDVLYFHDLANRLVCCGERDTQPAISEYDLSLANFSALWRMIEF